jgi:hypothetical protein
VSHVLKTFLFFVLPLILAMLVVGGCATAPATVSVPQEVKVPVTVFCKIEAVDKPILPFDTQATTSMTLFQKSQLLMAQDQVHKAYETKLEGAIQGCMAPPDGASSPAATPSVQ